MKVPTVLILDGETSGLWRENLHLDDPQQPWFVSIAFALCDSDCELQNFGRYLIKPDGRTIQQKAERVHGLTVGDAARFGVPEARVLGLLADLLKTMPMDSWIRLVTYGDFDRRVVSSLFARFAIAQNKPANTYDRLWAHRPLVEHINLMTPYCQQLCQIPSGFDTGEYKWPSLDEAAEILLGRKRESDKHDPWEDVMILRDLYRHCNELGMFKKGVSP